MIATVPFVQKTFDHFNALCFDGGLPAVPIVLTKAGTFLGKMEYKSRYGLFGIVSSHYDFRLKISTGFDLSQEELEDVIIHEMIHYYIAYRNLRDTSVHGETFRRIMDTINRKYGRHITVRHRGEPEQNLVRNGSTHYKKHYLCVSTFPDGKKGITVCASTKIFELYRLLPKHYNITKMEWYGSIDPFFNRFPRANTPKIYKITEEELSEHLKESVSLKCDGHTIEPIYGKKQTHELSMMSRIIAIFALHSNTDVRFVRHDETFEINWKEILNSPIPDLVQVNVSKY